MLLQEKSSKFKFGDFWFHLLQHSCIWTPKWNGSPPFWWNQMILLGNKGYTKFRNSSADVVLISNRKNFKYCSIFCPTKRNKEPSFLFSTIPIQIMICGCYVSKCYICRDHCAELRRFTVPFNENVVWHCKYQKLFSKIESIYRNLHQTFFELNLPYQSKTFNEFFNIYNYLTLVF